MLCKTIFLILSCVVAGRNKKVRQLCDLVFCEGRLVLAPVVLVGSLEALKGLFYSSRNGLLVMEQTSKEDQQVRQQPRHSVWEGCDKGAEAKHSPMPC